VFILRNPKMARYGKKNGRWKGGNPKTYYRKKAGCKRNDGKVVHHLTMTKLEVLNNRRISARAKHNKWHPEKGGNHNTKK